MNAKFTAYVFMGLLGLGCVSHKAELEIPEISTGELYNWIYGDNLEAPLILDVRAVEEYAVSHLQGAILFDIGNNEDQLPDDVNGRSIVIYCSVGKRSTDAVIILQEMGYPKVYNLRGGIFQWGNEERPLLNKKGRTPWVHPFNKASGKLLKSEVRYAED